MTSDFLNKNDNTRQYMLLLKFWIDERLFGVYNDALDASSGPDAHEHIKDLWYKCLKKIDSKSVADYRKEAEALQHAANEDVKELFRTTIKEYLKTKYSHNVHIRFPEHAEFLRTVMREMIKHVYIQNQIYFNMGYSEKEHLVSDIITRAMRKLSRDIVVPINRSSAPSSYRGPAPSDSVSRLIGKDRGRDTDTFANVVKSVVPAQNTSASVAKDVASRVDQRSRVADERSRVADERSQIKSQLKSQVKSQLRSKKDSKGDEGSKQTEDLRSSRSRMSRRERRSKASSSRAPSIYEGKSRVKPSRRREKVEEEDSKLLEINSSDDDSIMGSPKDARRSSKQSRIESEA